jgi:Tol biopolymer transport system component
MRRIVPASVLLLLSLIAQACQRDGATAATSPSPEVLSSVTPFGIVFTSERTDNCQIYAMNADGSDQRQLSHSLPYCDAYPSPSPNGRQIALASYREGFNTDIYVMTDDGSPPTRLTTDPGSDIEPDWSPDGKRIVFTSARSAPYQIYVMNADGSEETRLTNDPCSTDRHPRWSPDGSKIAFTGDCGRRDTTTQIYVINADGSGRTRLTHELTSNSDPSWSSDGRRIIYTSRNGISVMNADGSGQTPLGVSGDDPSWSPNGHLILFKRFVDFESADEIFVMNADGTGETRLTTAPSYDFHPQWLRPGAW